MPSINASALCLSLLDLSFQKTTSSWNYLLNYTRKKEPLKAAILPNASCPATKNKVPVFNKVGWDSRPARKETWSNRDTGLNTSPPVTDSNAST